MVPRALIAQRPHLMDAISRDDEPAVVELVLFGRIDLHGGAWLGARPSFGRIGSGRIVGDRHVAGGQPQQTQGKKSFQVSVHGCVNSGMGGCP